MNTDHLDPAMEECSDALTRHRDYRVLKHVPHPYANVPQGAPPDARCLAIVDLETTGLNMDEDRIIELALMLVWVDEEGEVLNHAAPRVWREDPGFALPVEITWLTGIANHHLIGQSIDDDAVIGLLDRADLLVAHNARFETGWLERRYPQIADAAWACTMKDIDWLKAGLDGRAQQHLLGQEGWFANAHRAAADVWSLLWLLMQRRSGWGQDPERTHMKRLLEGADRTTTLLQAKGAPYDKKDWLRGRGYHWNAPERCWQKEFEQHQLAHEQAQLYCQSCPTPVLIPMTARERHR